MSTKNYLFLFLIYFISCLLSANAKADHVHYHISDSLKNDVLEKLRQQNTAYETAYAFIFYTADSPTSIHKILAVSKTTNYVGFRINPTPIKHKSWVQSAKCLPVRDDLTQFTWTAIRSQATLIFPKQTNTLEHRLSGIKPGPIPVPVPVPFLTLKSQMTVSISLPYSRHYVVKDIGVLQQPMEPVNFNWKGGLINQFMAGEGFTPHFKPCNKFLK